MKNLVFEIGAEEIPASYIRPALSQLAQGAEAFFNEARLSHGGIRTEGTPRRLTLLVKALQDRQEDRSEEAMGPSAKVAFDAEGRPTQVAEGFARGKGIPVSKLSVRGTPKGDYVFAKIFQPGRHTANLLEEWMPAMVRKLNFPKSMRWAEGGPMKFARPISWLCAIYGERALKFQLEFLESGNRSYGHRFLSGGKPLVLKSAADYEKKLKSAHVMLSFNSRAQRIRRDLDAACKKIGSVIEDGDLVEICANLVEEPEVLLGHFDEKYLALPEAVIVKVLREHQFCFAARDRSGRLSNTFLAVTNGCKKNLDEIREGNARVMRARLEDASFFFHEDQKITLEGRLEALNHVVWQESLGSMGERVERLRKLAAWVAERLAPDAKEAAARAALLCKSDLVTLMIGEKEFTSLQGIMGGIYAALGKESADVALAIGEHYRPRHAGDAIPDSAAGQCLALADKMDDLAGSFGVGLVPTGSQDPYALRRKAAGIVAILRAQEKDLSLEEFAAYALSLYENKLKSPVPSVLTQLKDFFKQRLESVLAESGFGPDIIDATLNKRHDFTREAFQRAALLAAVSAKDDFQFVAQAFSRVNNILSKVTEIRPVQAGLLTEGPEKILYERFHAARPVAERYCQSGDFAAAFAQLANLRSAIDAYFAAVMVMTDDAALKVNRLSFLTQVSQTLNLIGDFTKLIKK
jgi:glycyl-tRNA synthetase beta chain